MCLYMLYYLKGMPFETVMVVRDKQGSSRGSVTFPSFEGDIFVVNPGRCPSHGAGWASGYKWGQTGPSWWGQAGPPMLSP